MNSLRILIGDDQIGVQDSLEQKAFLRNYGRLEHKFDFEANPDVFIERAKAGKYDALLIDLNWEEADAQREYKTGYRVLEAVRNCSPIRLLHTSDDMSRRRGMQYGATACIGKHRSPIYLDAHLKEGGQK